MSDSIELKGVQDSKFHDFVHAPFRMPDYRKSFIAMNGERLLSHLSRVYVAQIMEQFHVLVRLTTVLGNQYGYNFKSPGSNFCEPDLVSGQKRYIVVNDTSFLSVKHVANLRWVYSY